LLVGTTIWWLFFWTALGLCLGSFLNVVIYRLPREQSLCRPRFSHCPNCGHRIRWYDNIPVVSFLRLGGRCRDCQASISLRYPIVEMLTALVVLVVFDAFFVARTRVGLCNQPYLTWALAEDWPIFLAHVVLFGCLLAMAVIDLQEYWVDVRFTTVATLAGFVLHALWTPFYSLPGAPGTRAWPRPGDSTAFGAVAALLGLGLAWLWLRTRPEPALIEEPAPEPPLAPSPYDEPCRPDIPRDEGADVAAAPEPLPDPGHPDFIGTSRAGGRGSEGELVPDGPASQNGAPPQLEATEGANIVPESTGQGRLPRLGLVAVGAILLVTLVWMGLEAVSPDAPRSTWRSLGPILLVFVLVLAEAAVPRGADQEIMHAIEAERHSARRTALGELALLAPAIILGAAGVWLGLGQGAVAERLTGTLHLRPSGTWQPFYGLATAAAGYVIGGGIGWAVRIVFTLVFGKEAFGVGDIHMMAAAGCVAGWPVVLLAFIVTIFVALAAWVATLPFKRTRAIPLVPWLALGYLVVVVHYESLLRFGPVANTLEVVRLLSRGPAPTWPAGVMP